MRDEDMMRVVYFDGEIKNLQDLGCVADCSPTDVVSLIYAKLGTNGFSRLSGSFAFVLQNSRKTVLCRDQFGARQLYYYVSGGGIITFGSSVIELLNRGVPRVLNRAGLCSYLSYGCVCTPYTMIAGICAVPQGHVVIIENGVVTSERYWSPFGVKDSIPTSEVQSRVTEALNETILRQIRITGGRAPAAFLSGGIDSGAIVAIMRNVYEGEIRTYCVKHDDDRTEESAWAKLVADKNHTVHTVLHVSSDLVKENIFTILSSYDQPTVDGINFWLATKLIKEAGEDVVLSGEGGDELFAGYDRFAKHRMAYLAASLVRRFGGSVWGKPLGALATALAPNEKIRKLGELIKYSGDPYSLPRRIYNDRQVETLLKLELWTGAEDYHAMYFHEELPPTSDIVNRISWLELQTVTADMWLRDGAQVGGYNGVDVRTPLLDVRIAELLFRFHGREKLDSVILKPLLVRAAGDGLPMECVTRPKMGFSLPFQRYFAGDMKLMIDDFLNGNNLYLFDADAVRSFGKMYRAGMVNWSRVWALFVAEFWCKHNKIELP